MSGGHWVTDVTDRWSLNWPFSELFLFSKNLPMEDLDHLDVLPLY